VTDEDDVAAGIRRHISAFWPESPQEEFTWTLGPMAARMPRFRVRRVAPTGPEEPWVYLTVGAWEATEDDRAEFLILSPTETPRHVETLAMITYFHADPRYRLPIGRQVDIGRPWLEDSTAGHLLVTLPYPYGPSLEHCEVAGRHVQFRWLVPVTAAEARYAGEHGLESFEQLLEASGADVIDPKRPSIV
jgi:hypothetical protein